MIGGKFFFVSVIFLLGISLVTSAQGEVGEDVEDYQTWDPQSVEVEELNAEDEDETEVDRRMDGKKNLLGDKPVEISISPVDPNDFSCTGLPNGKPLNKKPKDCLSFYLCVNETAYQINCPKIPDQTYYNPKVQACDNSEPDVCITFLEYLDDGDEGDDKIDGGEIFDERDEL